ncbi:MAG: hypothetical protein OEY97_04345 [Nitrospirota bacterium]|nr:hypothetical protein [Nitrospirota bacterium]
MKWTGMLSALVLSAGLLGLGACAHGPAAMLSKKSPSEERLAREIGIELVSLRTTAGGHMLDLRFRVVNPEQASKLLRAASDIPMYLVEPASGQVAEIPHTMLGLLRTKATRTRPERIYYSLFKNPDMVFEPGDPVELHFGEVVVDGWKVN